MIEVVTLAGPLADAGKHRVARVLDGDVANQLHQRHGLAHAGAAEQADLAALGDRHDQVDHLDARFQQLGGGRLVFIAGRLAMDGQMDVRAHGTGLIHRITQHIHNAAQGLFAHGHRDGLAGVGHAQAPLQALTGAHGDGTHDPVAELLLDLQSQVPIIQRQGVIDLGQRIAGKFHVHHGADHLHNSSGAH